MAIYPMANILPDMLLLIDCNYLSNYSIASLIIERISTGQIFYLAVLRVQDVPQTDSGQTGQTIPYLESASLILMEWHFTKLQLSVSRMRLSHRQVHIFLLIFHLKFQKVMLSFVEINDDVTCLNKLHSVVRTTLAGEC